MKRRNDGVEGKQGLDSQWKAQWDGTKYHRPEHHAALGWVVKCDVLCSIGTALATSKGPTPRHK
jgi:hypothetical protein